MITTIGAALDWLIAHPSERLIDSKGDLWRVSIIYDRFQIKKDGKWAEPSCFQPEGLTWEPLGA